MGETSIEWTEASWNPVRGCSRVSRGCEHCYAEGVARRFSGPGQPYEGLVRLDREGRAKAQWNGTVRMVPEHLADPLRWSRPRRVFVNSMSDLFHEALSDAAIDAVFGVMWACLYLGRHAYEGHTFQVLTKRPERMREYLSGARLPERWAKRAVSRGGGIDPDGIYEQTLAEASKGPHPRIWLGVSVEDQTTADERIPHLLACPAAVRWASYEPAIGPVDFLDHLRGCCGEHETGSGQHDDECRGRRGLDWIVVGGESGPGARPFDLAWARSTVAQCREAGTACFVKQLGALAVRDVEPTGEFRTDETTGKRMYRMTAERLVLSDRKGGDINEFPADLRVREWPEVSR